MEEKMTDRKEGQPMTFGFRGESQIRSAEDHSMADGSEEQDGQANKLAHLAALYDRRMAIEEQIRDTKGARFGLKLVWTQIKTPQALGRFTLGILQVGGEPLGFPLTFGPDANDPSSWITATIWEAG
jgi:hypothetical protein